MPKNDGTCLPHEHLLTQQSRDGAVVSSSNGNLIASQRAGRKPHLGICQDHIAAFKVISEDVGDTCRFPIAITAQNKLGHRLFYANQNRSKWIL